MVAKVMWVLPLLLLSCATVRREPPDAAPAEVHAQLTEFRKIWLGPGRVAPPTIDLEPVSVQDGPWTATATPFLAEQAAWNRWPSGLRLLNDRAAYWFEIHVEGPGELRWLPEDTVVILNGREPLTAASSAESLLEPLFAAAVTEARWGLGREFADRTRAAGPFRDSYLTVAGSRGALHGDVGFPTGGVERHVTRIELEVSVATLDGTRRFRWLFD